MKTLSAIIIAALACLFTYPPLFSQAVLTTELDTLRSKYDEKVKLDVLRPHELAVSDLQAKFVSALERSQDAAQKAGRLEEAVALKAEKEAVLAGSYKPADDSSNAGSAIKTLRTTYLTALAKLELERDRKLQPISDGFSRSLDGMIDALTKSGKLDEAVKAKKWKAELRASSVLAPSSGLANTGFVNSLGMPFVPVQGTDVLFCIHETRKQDYAAYAMEVSGIDEDWKKPVTKEGVPVSDSDDHPVVMVNWYDAKAFCEWLSKREGREYRLPTDREWSQAVGIGRDEKADETPELLNAKVRNEYPWGNKWPPPKDSGNVADLATKQRLPDYEVVSDLNDGFATTAPVMKFKPNKSGIYDMAGNVWEWTEDWFNADNRSRVLRGGAWYYWEEGGLLSSYRSRRSPEDRNLYAGFRCVLVVKPK